MTRPSAELKAEIMTQLGAHHPARVRHRTSRGQMRFAVRWSVSPHPGPVPWGEGEPCSTRRTFQISWLSTGRGALFPLPEGEGQAEGKRRERASRVSDLSRNCRTGRVSVLVIVLFFRIAHSPFYGIKA